MQNFFTNLKKNNKYLAEMKTKNSKEGYTKLIIKKLKLKIIAN